MAARISATGAVAGRKSRDDRPADPADPLREEAGHLVGTDERLPVAERLFAQERALADLLAQRDEPAVVGAVGKTAQRFDIDGLVVGVVGDPVQALAETRERPGQGAGGQRDARLAIGTQPRDLVEQRRDGGRHEPLAVGVQVSLANGHEVARRGVAAVRQQSVEARLRKQPPHVGQDLPLIVGVGWHPVHDDQQWQTALLDAGQDGPRHLVGVAGRGRHEDAQVGCLDEPVGQGAIGVLERVDVRGVDRGRGPARWRRRSPGGPVRRGMPARAPSTSASWSSGWTRMTATRVVGRRTPVELAARPAIVLKIVLLPAPVGPTRRTTTGASREAARTRT